MPRKHHKGQASIGGIRGAEPIQVDRIPERDFRVGDRVLYRRHGGVAGMEFLATVDGLVVRFGASEHEIQVRPDQAPLPHFRTGDEVVVRWSAREGLESMRLPRDQEFEDDKVDVVPNAKIAGLVLKLDSGADLTIMPRHRHYEGLVHA